jgi:hypothetical protein
MNTRLVAPTEGNMDGRNSRGYVRELEHVHVNVSPDVHRAQQRWSAVASQAQPKP